MGLNLSYGFWQTRARKDPESLPFVLKNIRTLDRALANPAYMGLVITGLWMVWIGGYSWKAFWIWMSVLLLVLAAVLGITVYSPLLRRQIQVLETKGFHSEEYRTLEAKSNKLGIGLCILVSMIIFLMVTKIQF